MQVFKLLSDECGSRLHIAPSQFSFGDHGSGRLVQILDSITWVNHANVKEVSFLKNCELEVLGLNPPESVRLFLRVLLIVPEIALYLGYDRTHWCEVRGYDLLISIPSIDWFACLGKYQIMPLYLIELCHFLTYFYVLNLRVQIILVEVRLHLGRHFYKLSIVLFHCGFIYFMGSFLWFIYLDV